MILQMNRSNIIDIEKLLLASVAEKANSQTSEMNQNSDDDADEDDDDSTISPEETNLGKISVAAAKKRKRYGMTEEERREER